MQLTDSKNYNEYKELFENFTIQELLETYQSLGSRLKQESLYKSNHKGACLLLDNNLQEKLMLFMEDYKSLKT